MSYTAGSIGGGLAIMAASTNPVGWAILASTTVGFLSSIAYDNNFLGLQGAIIG